MNKPVTRLGCGSSGRNAFDPNKTYLINGATLNQIIYAQLRIASELTMTGDEMHDEAERINLALDQVTEAPEEKA
jgi:hypothetical protein